MLSVEVGGPRRRSVTSREAKDEGSERTQMLEPKTKDVKTAASSQEKPWKSARLAFALLAFVVSAAVLFRALGVEIVSPAAISGAIPHLESARRLGISLHPEYHATRPPKNVTLDWRVSAAMRSPDGVRKRVYLVNDVFPGPTIEVRSGDELRINVHNAMEDESVSIHWHGLQVPNGMDGAVGFTQCPIGPGENFTYQFQVGAQHGTFWWHAHFQSQRGDGLYGGLVVHQPREELASSEKPLDYEDDVLLLIGDWFHRPSDQVLSWYTNPGNFGNEPVPDSILINGVGRYDCSLAVPARPVECMQLSEAMVGEILQKGVKTRLRLVNVGTIAGITVSVDGASLEAVAVDASVISGVPAASLGILYPGERVDAVLSWTDSTNQGSRMNIILDDENFRFPNPALNPKQSFPIGSLTRLVSESSQHQDLSASYDLSTASAEPGSVTIPPAAQHTVLLYVKTQKLSRYNNAPRGFINHTSWAPQSPPLLSLPRSEWDKNQFSPFIPVPAPSAEPVWVDLIINNLDDGSHPFHLHGHSFYVLSSHRAEAGGWGSWSPYSGKPPPRGLNMETPVMKDTISVPRRGHVVLRFKAGEPGLWMLHCHMLVHLGSGMAAGIHIGAPDDEAHVLGAENSAAELCHAQ